MAAQNEPNFALFTSSDLDFLTDELFTETNQINDALMVLLVLFMSFARAYITPILHFKIVVKMAKFIVIQSRQVSKELHCFSYCFITQRAVCIMGYTEIMGLYGNLAKYHATRKISARIIC